MRREIARHDDLYHRQAAPEISDSEYDRLRQELDALERRAPEAARQVAPLPRVGDDRSGLFPTYRHRVSMLSLDKAHSTAGVRAFHARLVKQLGRDDLEYVVEPKYDGLAISVTYERGKLRRAVTRGDGTEGDDITVNVLQMRGVPRELNAAPGGTAEWPEHVELRGEIFASFAEFQRVNAERDAAGEPRFANPRNFAAGAVRQADASNIATRGLQVVFFGFGSWEPADSRPERQRDLHARLRTWGVPTVDDVRGARGLDELLRVLESVDHERKDFPFPTDGAVIKLDSLTGQTQVGASESAPRGALAYKFAPERVETELRAITLQVGRTGVLTPVAELAPVQVGGSRVTRATLHNREEIGRKDIRVGDFVYLEKAGEVIPSIVGVNLSRRPASARPYEFPVACPECFAALVRSEAEVAVRCPNLSCPAQVRRRIEHYASKACVDIDGLGPAMVDTLVGHGWVNDVPDLYRLRRADLLVLGRDNQRSVDRLLAAIDRSRQAELWRVIHGMGLPQVGAATAKDLARQCGSLAGLAENGPDAAAVLAEPRYQNLIAELIAVGVTPVNPASEAAAADAATAEKATSTAPPVATVNGRTFVFTGTLPTMTRAEAAARIERAGGTVADTVSLKTDYIVVGRNPGTKLARARELKIPVLDEPALLELIEGK